MSCWCVRAFRSRVLCSPPLQCAIASTAVALEGEPQRPLPSPTPAQVWFLKENRNIPPPLTRTGVVSCGQQHRRHHPGPQEAHHAHEAHGGVPVHLGGAQGEGGPYPHMKLTGVYLYTLGGRKPYPHMKLMGVCVPVHLGGAQGEGGPAVMGAQYVVSWTSQNDRV